MKLSSAQIKSTTSQFEAEPIPQESGIIKELSYSETTRTFSTTMVLTSWYPLKLTMRTDYVVIALDKAA